jgi:ubiquinone/menaquinone biosynthesis C-methylase UbiE
MESKRAIWNWLQKQADLNEAGTRDALLELCKQVSPIEVMLDCGCGDGEFTAMVAHAVQAKRVIGIDIVPEQIEKAKTKGIEGIICNLDKGLNVPDASVDMLIASQVIEHVADTDGLIKEFHRVLKPGGYLVVGTPNLSAFTNILFLLVGKQPTIVEVSDVALVGTWSPRKEDIERVGPAHRRIFTRGALKGFIQYYGFECQKLVGFGFLPLPPMPGRIAAGIMPVYSWNTIIRAKKPK